jgi:TolB-like protein
MGKRTIYIVVAALFFAGISWSQEKPAIAILDFEAQGVGQNEANVLTERIRAELFKTDKYRVMERSKMQEIFGEWGFQQAICNESECIVEAGNILGVEQMIAGSVQKIGTLYSISMRIVDVATGQVLTMGGADCNNCSIEQVALQTTRAAVISLLREPAPAEEPTTAELNVTSDPPGADVYLDGIKLAGTTPRFIEGITPGEHEIGLVRGDYVGDQKVVVNAGQSQRIAIPLRAKATDLEAEAKLQSDLPARNYFQPQKGAISVQRIYNRHGRFLAQVRLGVFGPKDIGHHTTAITGGRFGWFALKCFKVGVAIERFTRGFDGFIYNEAGDFKFGGHRVTITAPSVFLDYQFRTKNPRIRPHIGYALSYYYLSWEQELPGYSANEVERYRNPGGRVETGAEYMLSERFGVMLDMFYLYGKLEIDTKDIPNWSVWKKDFDISGFGACGGLAFHL